MPPKSTLFSENLLETKTKNSFATNTAHMSCPISAVEEWSELAVKEETPDRFK